MVQGQWYVSRIEVRNGDKAQGEAIFVAKESVLTIKDSYRAASRSFRNFKALGIENIGLYQWESNKKSYAASIKSQKRRVRKLTKADIAPAIAELAKEISASAAEEAQA